MNRCTPGALILLTTLTACGDPEGENGDGAPASEFVLSEAPVAAIGGSDERGTHYLHYAESALRLSDGRIVISDLGSDELRYFDS